MLSGLERHERRERGGSELESGLEFATHSGLSGVSQMNLIIVNTLIVKSEKKLALFAEMREPYCSSTLD